MVAVDALRGYVLEEVLAQLLYSNGYRLLVSEQQDPDALTRGAHGLLVRGRGTDHQADVLGELALPTPFSLPLRIFVEAKYRETKANLRDVRNAHGVVHDINEQYAPTTADTRSVPMRRYHYRYTLFSASGFTRPAQQYALAQQISLVDLSSVHSRGGDRERCGYAATGSGSHGRPAWARVMASRMVRLWLRADVRYELIKHHRSRVWSVCQYPETA